MKLQQMIKFFKNLFNLNKIVDKQQTVINSLKEINKKLEELNDKFNQITTNV